MSSRSRERKSIGARLRFEVLKRDHFTCQYCGRKAPDVVLVVDHLEPVSLGGENDPLNLLSACELCNAGKWCIPLEPTVVADKRAQLVRRIPRQRDVAGLISGLVEEMWSKGRLCMYREAA